MERQRNLENGQKYSPANLKFARRSPQSPTPKPDAKELKMSAKVCSILNEFLLHYLERDTNVKKTAINDSEYYKNTKFGSHHQEYYSKKPILFELCESKSISYYLIPAIFSIIGTNFGSKVGS